MRKLILIATLLMGVSAVAQTTVKEFKPGEFEDTLVRTEEVSTEYIFTIKENSIVMEVIVSGRSVMVEEMPILEDGGKFDGFDFVSYEIRRNEDDYREFIFAKDRSYASMVYDDDTYTVYEGARIVGELYNDGLNK